MAWRLAVKSCQQKQLQLLPHIMSYHDSWVRIRDVYFDLTPRRPIFCASLSLSIDLHQDGHPERKNSGGHTQGVAFDYEVSLRDLPTHRP